MKQLQTNLAYTFTDMSLLETALTHSSYISEHTGTGRDNQRLEFLGDTVIQMIISNWLFEQYPQFEEGDLTKLRSALTNTLTLSKLALRLELGASMRLGKGEKSTGGCRRESNLADTFEAVIGAIYLDGGLDAAGTVLMAAILAMFPEPDALLHHLNVSGPEHEPEFEVGVQISGHTIATAKANSRKQAEKDAARQALEALHLDGSLLPRSTLAASEPEEDENIQHPTFNIESQGTNHVG
jgi:ribonuclease-3